MNLKERFEIEKKQHRINFILIILIVFLTGMAVHAAQMIPE